MNNRTTETTYVKIKADCGVLDPLDIEHLTILTYEQTAELDEYGVLFIKLNFSAN